MYTSRDYKNMTYLLTYLCPYGGGGGVEREVDMDGKNMYSPQIWELVGNSVKSHTHQYLHNNLNYNV